MSHGNIFHPYSLLISSWPNQASTEYIHFSAESGMSNEELTAIIKERKLTECTEEIERYFAKKQLKEAKKFNKDQTDQGFIEWMQMRTFASGITPKQGLREIECVYDPTSDTQIEVKHEIFQNTKDLFQNYIYLGIDRYPSQSYSTFHDFYNEDIDIEHDGTFAWLLLFSNSFEKLKQPPVNIFQKLKEIISNSEAFHYEDLSGPGSSENITAFKETRKIFETLYASLKFDSLQNNPDVYECLCCMSKLYNSGYHLLQASRNCASAPACLQATSQVYLFHTEMLSSRQNLLKILEKLICDRIEEHEVKHSDVSQPETAQASLDFSSLEQAEHRFEQEEIKQIFDTVFGIFEEEKQPEAHAPEKHRTFGMNNNNFYFYCEGFGILKIQGNKIIKRSTCEELQTGKLSIFFLDNITELCVKREDATYTSDIPFLKCNEKFEIIPWPEKQKKQYKAKVREYREKDIQPLESTPASVIFENSDEESVRFMRATPMICDGAMIYALSCTVEIDQAQLSIFNEDNLWNNTDKWVKKVLYWSIHGYDKKTFFHKFQKKLIFEIEPDKKNALFSKADELTRLEEEVARKFQPDQIHKAVISIGYGQISIVFEEQIYVFSGSNGYLQPETKPAPKNVVGYSFDSNKYWYIKETSLNNGIIFKSFTFSKRVRSRIEIVQSSFSSFLNENITTSTRNKRESENFGDLLRREMFVEEESEPDTIDCKYTNSGAASVLPLFYLANNIPNPKDMLINFQKDQAWEYAKGNLHGIDSPFEMTREFYQELTNNITMNYEALLDQIETELGSRPAVSLKTMKKEQLHTVSINYSWILRTHLLLRIYFFSLKQILDVEISPSLIFGGEAQVDKFFCTINYFIEFQHFLENSDPGCFTKHLITIRHPKAIEPSEISSIVHIKLVNREFLKVLKIYYYSICMMNKLAPTSIEEEKFDIFKLLSNVNLRNL
ncbi:unnamed protein product [Moneuplotes crassus]|uniref:Uncharacterized protein n=1 Tax=Euplotes crassus TaxID=5936 RepID=A0AAD2D716_EUPCR|nr:unnamed protein product [Moneuplotes crassus]